MKKSFLILIIVSMSLILFSCSNDEISLDGESMTIGTLMGPTGMGMAHLMEMSENGETEIDYHFEIFQSPDELVGKIVSGEVDVAAVPTNMASILYNRTDGNIELSAINTLGVLYVLENGDSINNISDLDGKDLYVSGKAASPDFIIQYLLNENNLNANISYSLQHADLAAALVEGDVDIALLPQPHVTTAIMRNEDIRVALDITEEWEAMTGLKLPMGSLINQKKFAEENPDVFNQFLKDYEASINFVNNNIDESAELIEKFNILPNKMIAKKAIPYSNIVFIHAEEGKDFLDEFFNILYEFEPNSIGGKLPDEAFYHQK